MKKLKKINVFKNKNERQMWYGHCLYCRKNWQFHFFGATLGYGLEHLRRCR